jgi:CBS domain-containing protein
MNERARVGDLMTRSYVGVSESDGIRQTVAVMDENDVGSAVVLRGAQPVGIVTERDIVAAVAADRSLADPVEGIMSAPVVTVATDATVEEALQLLSESHIRRLPVLDDGDLVGIVTHREVLMLFGSEGPEPTAAAATGERGGLSDGGARPGHGEAMTDAGAPMEESPAAVSAGTTVGTTQGICENCGRFARDLSPVDGRVLCGDCRDV